MVKTNKLGKNLMYKNVLITGAKGFIGKHLIRVISSIKDINVYEYNKQSPWSELESILDNIDFIFHLAGEVNPKSASNSFIESNVNLTQKLIELLQKKERKIPILLASSIHAENPKNDYGITKKQSEDIIMQYGISHNVPVYIYRLFHIFGEECRPNYNSVISTWIYNSIHDLDIQVFDREIAMHYSYVKDVAKEFASHLHDAVYPANCFFKSSLVYDTTLGEVVDYINEFKSNILNSEYQILDNAFKQKLFSTYHDYYQKKTCVHMEQK